MCVFKNPKEKNEESERRDQAEVKLQREAGTPSLSALWKIDTRNSSSLRADDPQWRPSPSPSPGRTPSMETGAE